MTQKLIKFIDLFAGIGGMRIPLEELGCKCIFSSEWDVDAQKVYQENFGEIPVGDITQVEAKSVPNHDILLAGFPCQAFSIIGKMNGFEDTRGTLFFDIERILREKKPTSFILENVKMLVGHRKGQTFQIIQKRLNELGYFIHWKVLNALNFGLPHKRERVFIVGFLKDYAFKFPHGIYKYKPLREILEKEVPNKYYASERIIRNRKEKHTSNFKPAIWHENKGGNISSHPFSCALRAHASYNYLLVDGERRITPRESLRLLGFPEHFKTDSSYTVVRKLTGNSVCVPVVLEVAKEVLRCLQGEVPIVKTSSNKKQMKLDLNIGSNFS